MHVRRVLGNAHSRDAREDVARRCALHERDVNSDASDLVSYAYNAQDEEIWRQD